MASYFESAYKQLLMGVSQQTPKDRLDGQLEEQINMTSDLVYGLRRRSPMRFEGTINAYWDADKVAVLPTRLTGEKMWVLVSIADGTINCINQRGDIKWNASNEYLKASSQAAIRFATMNNRIYIANVERAPQEKADSESGKYPDPRLRGYWAVQSSAFDTIYYLNVTFTDTGESTVMYYRTPAAAQPNSHDEQVAVQQSTRQYIAQDFVKKVNAIDGVHAEARDGILFIYSEKHPIAVYSSNPNTLVRASGSGRVRTVDELPSSLNIDFMDNFIMEVGTGAGNSAYYRYDRTKGVWLEDAAWGTSVRPFNMPLSLTPHSESSWTLEELQCQRRPAGDSKSNPSLKCLTNGITGMGVFQGRLVLLSGEYVCMSATNNPLMWYRTTVETLSPSDPIEAAGSDSSSSPYVYVTLFNKDLVVYGSDVQAIIPGNQAVTPSNVVVGVMSRYKCSLYAAPATTGRSQYVGATRGDGYGGLWEITPSDYVASQIVANDVTSHIPSYVKGVPSFIAASTTSSIVVAGFSDEPTALLVEEYYWEGTEKKQAAWHKWTFNKSLLYASFEQDTLWVLINDREAQGTHLCSLDLRRGAHKASITVPRLDFHKTFRVQADGRLVVPLNYWKLISKDALGFKITGQGVLNVPCELGDPEYVEQLVYVKPTGVSVDDEIVIGSTYESMFQLTPPKVSDQNGVAMTTFKSTIQEYFINWVYTGNYSYMFKDSWGREVKETNIKPCNLRSELDDPYWLPKDNVKVRYPVRMDMQTIKATFKTSGVYDLCPELIEYGARYNQVRGRRI